MPRSPASYCLKKLVGSARMRANTAASVETSSFSETRCMTRLRQALMIAVERTTPNSRAPIGKMRLARASGTTTPNATLFAQAGSKPIRVAIVAAPITMA